MTGSTISFNAPRRIRIGAVVALVSGMWLGCATAPPTEGEVAERTLDPEVHGHRGARSVFPESSMEAFLHALDAGVDVLEMDTVVTSDDQVVVLHDPVLNPDLCGRMDGGDLPGEVVVRALTLEQLRAYHCTRLLHDRFPRQGAIPPRPIPTLAEVIDGVLSSGHPRAGQVRFNVETKIQPDRPELAPEPAVFTRLLLDVFRERGLLDRLIFQSFDPRTLVAAAEQEPSVTRAILLGYPTDDVVAAARAARSQVISPYHVWLTAEHVEAARAAGMPVVPWTANSPEQWQQLVLLGVDGIITDDPAGLMDWLGSRGP